MFLEQEVYPLLKWGFLSVVATQLIFVIGLWINQKFDKLSFLYILTHISLLAASGFYLYKAMTTFEVQASMRSEEASISMVMAGLLWALSVLFLILAILRLVRESRFDRYPK